MFGVQDTPQSIAPPVPPAQVMSQATRENYRMLKNHPIPAGVEYRLGLSLGVSWLCSPNIDPTDDTCGDQGTTVFAQALNRGLGRFAGHHGHRSVFSSSNAKAASIRRKLGHLEDAASGDHCWFTNAANVEL